MEVSIRPATRADLPVLEIVRRQAIEASFGERYEPTRYATAVATDDPGLPRWVAEDRFRTQVLETRVTPAAFGVLDTRSDELLALYTAPDYRGRGYATRVFDALVEDRPHRAIEAWVPEPSIGYFEGVGFQRTGERRGDPIPAARIRWTP